MAVVAGRKADATAIRPFRSEAAGTGLQDLRARIAAARWPGKETAGGRSRGVQLAAIQALARYWHSGYGWRRREARLNAPPQSVTGTGGPGIHLIHVRSGHDGALPLIVTHGRPGPVTGQLKITGPLADPAAHGASACGASHLVIPSLPGDGFCGKPATAGRGPGRIARARAELMRRLGCTRYAAQGGDRGAMAADVTGTPAPPGCSASTSPGPFTVPPDTGQAVQPGRCPGPARRRTARLRAAGLRLRPRPGLDAAPPADDLRTGRFAGRPGRLAHRPRHPQLRADRPRLRRPPRGPDPGRPPGQHHAVLAGRHGRVLGAPTGRTAPAPSSHPTTSPPRPR